MNNQDARAISDRAPYRHTMGQSQENTIQAGGGGEVKNLFPQKIVTVSPPPPPPVLPGPGSGSMSNAKRWRESLPTSFKSPFHAQADLGFFSLGRKQYGGFFLAVNCFSGHICVFKINNTRMPTLLTAIGKMTKVSVKKRF